LLSTPKYIKTEEEVEKNVKIFRDGDVFVGIVPSFSEQDKVYTITYNLNEPNISCNCPSFVFRGKPCKHIAVFVRVLNRELAKTNLP
jgi:hypothetical protein